MARAESEVQLLRRCVDSMTKIGQELGSRRRRRWRRRRLGDMLSDLEALEGRVPNEIPPEALRISRRMALHRRSLNERHGR